MAAKAYDYNGVSRRYCLGVILKWMIIRDKTQEQIFNLSKSTWISRKNLDSDFTTEELRRACYLLRIPADEQVQMLTGGES